VQTQFGYTAMLAGMVLTPGGFVTLCVLPVVGRLTSMVQPRLLLAAGLSMVALATWHLTSVSPDITFEWAAWARVFQAIGLPFVFVTVTSASYFGLPGNKSNEASGLINVARNVGGSIGISLSQTLLEQRGQFHQARLVENIMPSSLSYQHILAQVTAYFVGRGSPSSLANQQATTWIAEQVLTQSTLLAFIDVFFVYALIATCSIPIAFLLKKMPLGAGSPAAA
jgi:DHA2 family multidrug resistance protein